MQCEAGELVRQGIRGSTARSYASIQKNYVHFCTSYLLRPLPASKDTILLYIAHLHRNNISAGSLKVHLAAVRNMHLLNGFTPPDNGDASIKLAVKAVADTGPAPSQKAPLTYTDLQKLWPVILNSDNSLMWQSVVSLAFFGGLRCSEYAINATHHSAPATVSCISFTQQGHLKYKVPRSKTKAHGLIITLGCSGVAICATCTLKEYLKHKVQQGHVQADSCLYTVNSKPLTTALVNSFIAQIVTKVGWDPNRYSAHSLRAGAATTAAAAGFSEWELKKMGGWESKAYISYVRDINLVAGFSKRLVNH